MIYQFIKTGILGLFTTGTSCYIAAKIEAIKIPIIANHFVALVSINRLKVSPNLNDKYETMKNLNPLETRQIKKKISKLMKLLNLRQYLIEMNW